VCVFKCVHKLTSVAVPQVSNSWTNGQKSIGDAHSIPQK